MSVSCHCYNCNYSTNSTNSYLSSNNDNNDKQNLILQVCKGIFEAIQNENTTAVIICSMSHRQIRNIHQVESCINEEFGHLFINNILRKEIKDFSIYTWRIRFKWSGFNNDSLIKNLLKISKEWYDPFTNHLQKINNQKRNEWFYEQNGEDGILDNLKKLLPGFKYLFEYSWKSSYYNNNCYGDFVFASDSGIFIMITVNARNERIFQSLKYKNKASEIFERKYVAFLGATYNYDEDVTGKATLEFNYDNDEIMMQNLKEIHNNSLQGYNNNRIGTLVREEQIEDQIDQIAKVAAGAVVGIAAVAAVAGVGYLAYKAASNKTVRRAASEIASEVGVGLAFSLIQELEKERRKARK